MEPTHGYTLAQLSTDRPDWERECARLEAEICQATADAGQSLAAAVLRAQFRRADGTRVLFYETPSRAIYERFLTR